MAVLTGFDATKFPRTQWTPLPVAEYLAVVTNSVRKTTKKGDGSYLHFEFTITEGEYSGRRLDDRMVIEHPCTKTVRIAKEHLSELCTACGMPQPNDTHQLHGIPVVLAVGQKKSEWNGEVRMENVIRSFKSRAQAARQPPAVAPGDPAPWSGQAPVST